MEQLDMNWVIEPEVNNYRGPNDCQVDMTYEQADVLFAWTIIAYNNVTLLNPLNVQYFFLMLEEKNFEEIKSRFGFTTDEQIICFGAYINYQTEQNQYAQPIGS